jgi:hypothetical protein
MIMNNHPKKQIPALKPDAPEDVIPFIILKDVEAMIISVV